MAQSVVSVTQGVGLEWSYQEGLAATLLREGMLRRKFRSNAYLDLQVLDPAADGSLQVVHNFPVHKIISRLAWAIWRRMPKAMRDATPVSWVNTALADQLLRPWIPRTQIFHGCMNNCLGQLARAQQLGAVTLVDIGSSHPKHWRQAIIDERKRFGIDHRGAVDDSGVMIRRMEHEFAACDKLIVLCSAARRSFEGYSYGGKTEIVMPGTDHTFFTPPAERKESPVFRVCYAGRVELAKGVAYLVEAWKRLALPNAELTLIGKVQPDATAILKDCEKANIKLTGFVDWQQLAQHYRESDVFAFPSLTEGFGLVLLEAMACGLPFIASNMSGAEDCLTERKEGFVVPARDVDRMEEAILWCYQHREEIQRMGKAARARIENHFTLDHYYQRQIALYRSLAGES